MMLAKVKGSLYYAVLFVSITFAAATGIVVPVTILGIMAAKSMNRSGYDVRRGRDYYSRWNFRNINPTKHYVSC